MARDTGLRGDSVPALISSPNALDPVLRSPVGGAECIENNEPALLCDSERREFRFDADTA